MNDSPGQKKSAATGFVIITAIAVIAVAGQCNKTPKPDAPEQPVPVISIK